jgi:glycerate kinase
MRVLVAPQEFKGSLAAAEAAHAIALGVRDALPDAELVEAPMSDGGAGLVDALLTALGGERVETVAHDPLMRSRLATWALLSDGRAAIEMAAASGLVLLTEGERDPLIATTYGTGELMRAALERGCGEMIVGVGGSATVDGGAGAMQALGARLLDAGGGELPSGGAALAGLDRIDVTGVDARLRRARVRVACDVTNPLCGPEGAAAVFGPQKGASPGDVTVLEAALARFAAIVARDCGVGVGSLVGAGAAGGLAAGLAALGATLERGFDLVATATGLDEKVARMDVVITGEGRLDVQTAYGKTASGVAAVARRHGKRIACVAGTVDARVAGNGAFDAIEAATPAGMNIGEAMRRAGELVRAAAARVVVRL